LCASSAWARCEEITLTAEAAETAEKSSKTLCALGVLGVLGGETCGRTFNICRSF